jgi:hypothetical protein
MMAWSDGLAGLVWYSWFDLVEARLVYDGALDWKAMTLCVNDCRREERLIRVREIA